MNGDGGLWDMPTPGTRLLTQMLAEDPGVCRTRGHWYTYCSTDRKVLNPRTLWRHWRWVRRYWS